MKTTTKWWLALGVLALLSPLGLILPEHFKADSAWGEWDAGEIKQAVGYIPQKLEQIGEIWKAPMPDYAFKGWEKKGLAHLSFAYVISAVVGTAVIAMLVWLLGKFISRKDE